MTLARFAHMSRPGSGLRLIASLVLLAGLPGAAVLAQDFSAGNVSRAFPYKDLPGVQDPAKARSKPDVQPDCTQEVHLRHLSRHDNLLDDEETGIFYRCVQDGLIIESSRPPRSSQWNPLDIK